MRRWGRSCCRSHALRRKGARLDRLAGQPLADHVELFEAGIKQRHRAALALVRDLDLKADHIAELSLERGEVGIDGALFLEYELTGGRLGALRSFFRLADGEPLRDDVPRQRLGVRR